MQKAPITREVASSVPPLFSVVGSIQPGFQEARREVARATRVARFAERNLDRRTSSLSRTTEIVEHPGLIRSRDAGSQVLMRIAVVSDTHNRLNDIAIPPADILVHCGDFCGRGTLSEVETFAARFSGSPHPHKIVIAGNHDRCFESRPDEARQRLGEVHYLQDRGIVLKGVRFYGSPWQPWFFDWAFNLERGEPLRRVWAQIPEATEVLITHGPPMGVLDRTVSGERVGCEDLMARVREVRPRLHLFGHIHEGYGSFHDGKTLFVNASSCDEHYRPCQPAVLVERDDEGTWRVVE